MSLENVYTVSELDTIIDNLKSAIKTLSTSTIDTYQFQDGITTRNVGRKDLSNLMKELNYYSEIREKKKFGSGVYLRRRSPRINW